MARRTKLHWLKGADSGLIGVGLIEIKHLAGIAIEHFHHVHTVADAMVALGAMDDVTLIGGVVLIVFAGRKVTKYLGTKPASRRVAPPVEGKLID